MSPSSWQRAVDLLYEALEQPPEDREDFVARRSGSDDALRREVESLLATDSELIDHLESPCVDLLAPVANPRESRIGPYEIVRELGRGGTGVVYLAERTDGEYRKRVAIKVVRYDLESEALLRRFRAERQILANLDHPNIAKLYEGGTTTGRRPYIVMEYVDGEPIDAYCRSRNLSLRRCVGLVTKVCAAVELAHRNLVIHRDLKPSNVLVDRCGEPKLLDFGIAKILDPEASPPVTLTNLGAPPMTPQYASPEQFQGRAITTATDVYALGLILYELLCGEPPFRLGPVLDGRAFELICRREPERPSSVLQRRLATKPEPGSERHRARKISGDLDCIVLKALRKEPEHRYGTVERLRDDLERHLAGLPVRARRGTLPYRVGKLLRRNAKSVVVGSVLAVLLGGLVVDHEIQGRRAARASERAKAAATYLAELFLFSSDTAADARSVIPREVLDRGAATFGELDDQPELRADLMAAVGRGYLSLRLVSEATPILENALELRRSLYGERHLKVAESLHHLALLRAGQGRFQEAEQGYREALSIRQALSDADDPLLPNLWNELAAVLLDQGRYRDAEPLFRRALEARRRQYGDGHPRVSAIAGNLGITLFYRGHYREARELFRSVLEATREQKPESDGQVCAAKINLAAAMGEDGDLAAAESLLREVLAVHRGNPPTPALGPVLDNLARNLFYQGRLADSESTAKEAVAVYRRFFGDEHVTLARAEILLARIRLARGDHVGAEPLLRRAATLYRRSQSPDHWRGAEAESLLGECLLDRGLVREAGTLLRSSHQRIRSQTGEQSRATHEAAARVARLERLLADAA